jgi:hypothetical protein
LNRVVFNDRSGSPSPCWDHRAQGLTSKYVFQQIVKKWLIFHLNVDILVVLWYIFNKGLKIHKVFI